MGHKKPGPKPQPLMPRIMEKVEMVDGCWLWQGFAYRDSPVIRVNGKMVRVRRAIALHEGMAPDLYAAYACPNKNLLCVAPDHIEIVSKQGAKRRAAQALNSQPAMLRRHRLTKGSASKRKLTGEQLRTVQLLLDKGWHGAALARMFSVSPTTISRIKHNRIYREHPANNPFALLAA